MTEERNATTGSQTIKVKMSEPGADQQPEYVAQGAASDDTPPNTTASASTSEEQHTESTPEPEPEPETDTLDQRVAQAEAQAAEYKDQWLRVMADLKNYKRRAEAERDELRRNASSGVLLKLLPILDDIERAMDNVPPEVAESPWWEGMTMIAQKFQTMLESEGVQAIEAVGNEFDPNVHHAVTYEEAEGQDGKVVAALQKGYMLRDRVLRPAMVKVGKG